MENRNALIVDAELTTADGYAERATALEMLARLPKTARRRTVAGDKGYDTKGFVADVRAARVHPARRPEHHRPTLRDRRAHHPPPRPRRQPCGSANGSRNPSAGSRPSPAAASSATAAEQRNRAWFKITAAVYNLIRITALDTQTRLRIDSAASHGHPDQPANTSRRHRQPNTNHTHRKLGPQGSMTPSEASFSAPC